MNETVLRNGSWFAEKPGVDKWENPWTQIGMKMAFPNILLRHLK